MALEYKRSLLVVGRNKVTMMKNSNTEMVYPKINYNLVIPLRIAIMTEGVVDHLCFSRIGKYL